MKKASLPPGFRKPPLPGRRPFGERESVAGRATADLASRFSSVDLRLDRARNAARRLTPLRSDLKSS